MSSYPSRRSTRLPGYDYSQPGAYFITLCTELRRCLFGTISDGRIHLSPAGRMVDAIWANLGSHYPGVLVDSYILMPNHLHGVLLIADPAEPNGGTLSQPAAERPSISTVIQRFKTYTAHEYGKGVASDSWPRYPGRLWQHRFHDHVIRHERELSAIREYIANNPLQWQLDRENPDNRRRR